MRPVLLVPGIQNSGPDHWQTRWEMSHPGVVRVQQRDWDRPDCAKWAAALDHAVRAQAEPPIVVAHSLGCLVAARWMAESAWPVHAALLVAVPDPQGPAFPAAATGFTPLPPTLGDRRVLMLSSSNDPYSTPAFTRQCAAHWQAQHEELGALGHINAASGLGDWPEGWARVGRWRTERS
jgi:uncharacterized protein